MEAGAVWTGVYHTGSPDRHFKTVDRSRYISGCVVWCYGTAYLCMDKTAGSSGRYYYIVFGACGRNCPYTGHISCGFTADGALRADSDDDWKSGQKDVNAGHSVCLSGSSLEGIVCKAV